MTERTESRSSFIIATRDRPEELLRAVESLVLQTVLPKELCVIDSSAESPVRATVEQLCAGVGLSLDYHHPAPRGLTVQRNIGIDRTRGDPVFLIDDDVYLEPDCHEEILKEYERWGPELGGVGPTPTHPSSPRSISVLWRRLFGIGGWWPEASGRMRSGFWVEGVLESAGVRRVDCFLGYFMSFRRKVFENERFDEALAGYADKEDIDFTYRVSRRFVLVQTPRARCDHLKTETSRLAESQLQRMKLSNHLYLYRKNMPQDLKHKVALWWGFLGLLILNIGQAVFRRDSGLISGIVVGAWEQARRKGLIDPVVEKARGSL
ncbi:MAG: glycosyltransferase family 2 protein [Actinomycetota bacterium]